MMLSFLDGLFVGEGEYEAIRDNLSSSKIGRHDEGMR